MFEQQTNAFKINMSYGFVLKNKNTGCYRYYHSSCNCCGRYLDEPSLITDREEFGNHQTIRRATMGHNTKAQLCVGL